MGQRRGRGAGPWVRGKDRNKNQGARLLRRNKFEQRERLRLVRHGTQVTGESPIALDQITDVSRMLRKLLRYLPKHNQFLLDHGKELRQMAGGPVHRQPARQHNLRVANARGCSTVGRLKAPSI